MEDADDDVDDIEWENGNGVVRCHNDEMTRDWSGFEAQLKMVSRILKMLEMGDASLDNWEELHQSMYPCYYYYDDDNVMWCSCRHVTETTKHPFKHTWLDFIMMIMNISNLGSLKATPLNIYDWIGAGFGLSYNRIGYIYIQIDTC